MLNSNTVKNAAIACGNDYIMAMNTITTEQAIDYIDKNNFIIDSILFNPNKNQIRISYYSELFNGNVFNIANPSISFLRTLWSFKIKNLQLAIKEYMTQGNIKSQFNNILPYILEDEKKWLMTIILGSAND